VIFFSSMVYW